MFKSLSGKKVVIIGASSGVDLAVAQKIAELGASVVISDSSQNKLNQAIELIYGQIEVIDVDTLNEDSVNSLFEKIKNFDHLVVTTIPDRNIPRSLLKEMTTETAQGGMKKFWGAFFAVRAALETIAQDGSITLISSAAILKTSKMGGISAIAAASGAVAVFGRSLAAELAPIRVNVIASGVMDAGVWGDYSESDQSQLAQWANTSLPVQHLGQAEELAQAVLSLITNPYITGVVLPVDGGLTIL